MPRSFFFFLCSVFLSFFFNTHPPKKKTFLKCDLYVANLLTNVIIHVKLLRAKWPQPEEDTMQHIHEALRDVEQKVIEDARVRHESKHHIL
jgi:hypothetical protein